MLASNVKTELPKGGLFLGVLVEGSTGGSVATEGNLKSWIRAATAPNTWVLDSVDPQPKMEDFFNTGRDYYVLVDLSTMKIVDQGYSGDPMGALAALDAALAK